MTGDRIEAATKRIEAALARIAKASEQARHTPPSVSKLVVEHETLRETVTMALKEIDKLISDSEE